MPDGKFGDTSVLTRFFHHNTWANLKLLDFCAGLSDEQLNASAVGTLGSIRDTLVHIVSAEVDYVNLAKGLLEELMSHDPFPGFEALRDEDGIVTARGVTAAIDL